MEVYLAGYNLDADVIDELKETHPKREDVTPETLSAAYARISRDPAPINELRKRARNEVAKARKSNSAIIFKMGHHSVAEHAVFNFDIINVSRLVMEEIEKFRLCSFTEKSQRYITLENDFVIPKEIKGTEFEEPFTAMIQKQNGFYHKLYAKLKKEVFAMNAGLAADEKNHNLLEGWAKEDARYITSLATHSQVGLTINARNLEHLFRRFASHPIQEVQDLGKELYKLVENIAPSIILFAEANDFDVNKYKNMKKVAEQYISDTSELDLTTCRLVDFTEKGDEKLMAVMLNVSTNQSFTECLKIANNLSIEQKMDLVRETNKDLVFYDSVVREYEMVDLTYDLVLSAACFGQLKRHRMSSQVMQDYDPKLGLTIPESVINAGLEDEFRKIAEESAKLYYKMKGKHPLIAKYILTNAHRRRMLLKTNARELYHISRLREDKHAQWDIRILSEQMSKLAKKVMPVTFAFIGGKDRFEEIYKKAFETLAVT